MKCLILAALMTVSNAVFAKTYEVDVTGMNCSGCSKKLQKSVMSKLTGVKTAKADHKTGKLVFEADDATQFSQQDIQTAIEDKNEKYEVTKVKTK